MKHLLSAVSVLLCVYAHAQRDFFSGHAIWAGDFGLTHCRPEGLNSLATSPDGGFTNLLTFGLSVSAPTGTRSSSLDGAIALHFFRPSNTISGWSDSTNKTIQGWELMTSIYGFDLLKSVDAFDVVVAPGIYWGKLKVTQKSLSYNTEGAYSNVFIAPMARVDVRVVLGAFAIGARFSYRFDISKDRWNRDTDNLAAIPGYRFRDIQYVGYIGFVIRSSN